MPAFVELVPVGIAAVPSAEKIVVLQMCFGVQLVAVSASSTAVRIPGVDKDPPDVPTRVVKPVGRGLIP